jgi:hypothetical protein
MGIRTRDTNNHAAPELRLRPHDHRDRPSNHVVYATKPNPFEIISLQTTREKNNWKTEETLARAVVILETERIEGSNP